jgi:hypothetical protein
MGGNLKISFRQLHEGGNVRVGDVQADQILASKIDRQSFVKELTKNLLILNDKFEEKYGLKIWAKDSYITSGKVFSGSSEHFINTEGISDEDYGRLKPKTGDIDVQMSEDLEERLHLFFKTETTFGSMEYLGQSQSAIGQISALFAYKGWNVQIDFEFVEIGPDGMPTEWSAFSRSSAWKDIEAGIKGVMHKFAIATLDHAYTKVVNLKKGKRKPTITPTDVHFFAFSVAKGLRPKYREVQGEPGVWEAIPPKEGKYTRDIAEIFMQLYKKKATSKDREMFNSFVGVIDLVDKYMDKKQTKKMVGAFAEFIWGKGAQKLYRGDPIMDAQVKHAAFDYIEKKLGVKKSKYDAMMNSYYENY